MKKTYRKAYYNAKIKVRIRALRMTAKDPTIASFRQFIDGKSRRIKRSGEDVEKVLRLLKANKCNVCGGQEPIKNRRLCIDHCHKSGRVRGILCSTCNRTLGLLKDNPKFLANLLNYLLEFEKAGYPYKE